MPSRRHQTYRLPFLFSRDGFEKRHLDLGLTMDESDGDRRQRLMLEDLVRSIGRDVKARLPAGIGFTALIFDYGPGGRMAYISTAERDDMIRAFQEAIDKLNKEQN